MDADPDIGLCFECYCAQYPDDRAADREQEDRYQCAAYNHEYYGDYEGRGRCYCGEKTYPVGGPSADSAA